MGRQAKDGSFPSDKPGGSTRWADWGTPASGNSAFTWRNYDAVDMLELVGCVTDEGDAISFARNRPRTGGSITILAGGAPIKLYVANDEEWNAVYREIVTRYPGKP